MKVKTGDLGGALVALIRGLSRPKNRVHRNAPQALAKGSRSQKKLAL